MAIAETRLSATQWLKEQNRTEVYSASTVTIPSAGIQAIPEEGFDVTGRKGKSFFVRATGACTVYIQGKAFLAGMWGTLKRATQVANGTSLVTVDEVRTILANETAWIPIPEDAMCKYIRLYVSNTSGADNSVTVEECGGR